MTHRRTIPLLLMPLAVIAGAPLTAVGQTSLLEPSQPAVKPLVTAAEYLDVIDDLQVDTLRTRLKRNRRLDRDGQELLKRHARLTNMLARFQQDLIAWETEEEVMRLSQLLAQPQTAGQLGKQLEAAKSGEEIAAVIDPFLRKNGFSPRHLMQIKLIQDRREAVRMCRNSIPQLERELQKHEQGQSRIFRTDQFLPVGRSGQSAVEQVRALQGAWRPESEGDPEPERTEAPTTEADYSWLKDFFARPPASGQSDRDRTE